MANIPGGVLPEEGEGRLQRQQDAEEGVERRPYFQSLNLGADTNESDGKKNHYDMPTARDSRMLFAAKKGNIITKVVPLSLVPISTSNGMLFLGSQLHFSTDEDQGDCFFPLPEYIVVTGAVSLSLVVMGVMSRHVVDWVMDYHRVNYGHAQLIRFMEVTGSILALAQAALLMGGTVLLLPQFHLIETKKPKEGEKRSPFYCDYHLVMYTSIFLAMSWLFVLFAAAVFLYVMMDNFFSGRPPPGKEVSRIAPGQEDHVVYRRDDGYLTTRVPTEEDTGTRTSSARRRKKRSPPLPGLKQKKRSFSVIKNFHRLPSHVKEKIHAWNKAGRRARAYREAREKKKAEKNQPKKENPAREPQERNPIQQQQQPGQQPLQPQQPHGQQHTQPTT